MNAPMKIYVPVMDGKPLSSWHYSTSPYAPEKDVEFIRADIHESEMEKLHHLYIEGGGLTFLADALSAVDALKAENAALHAECDRLTAMLTPKDTALSRLIGADGFTEDDPMERLRFFCSLAMNGQDWIDVEPFFGAVLTEMLGPQKVLSAEAVTQPGFYWHRYGTEEWCVVDVDFGYPYGRLFIWTNGEQDHGLEGQFRGPIRFPEVKG